MLVIGIDVDRYLFSESRVKKVDSSPKTLERLYGMEYPIRGISEPIEATDVQMLQYNKTWNDLCNSKYYAHIRICGRAAQLRAESEGFLLEDLFRIYRFTPIMNGRLSTRADTKIDFNREADLWVFYISPPIDGEKERYIWVQPPKHMGAIRVVLNSITYLGMRLSPYDRNNSGFKLIDAYKDQLKEITSKINSERFFRSFQRFRKVVL